MSINNLTVTNNDYYSAKFEYYRQMNVLSIIFSVLSETAFFVSDCQLFGRFAIETLIPRFAILIILLIFLIINHHVKNYKIMIPLSYFVIHATMWSTIWPIYYLPIKTHASEGFIIMHLMFLAVGFCAPRKWALGFHSLIIVNILVSHLFNHYENLDIMLSLAIPCIFGINGMLWMAEKSFKEQFWAKQELKSSLLKDQLTNVYNRHKIKDITINNTNNLIFDKAIIAILDIDLFKNINDTYGHEKGDQILVLVSKELQNNIRKDDYIIRWGGEEFLIILPNCRIENANEILERIRTSIENMNNDICQVTISAGFAEYDGEDYHNTLLKADIALYYAKHNGRNQIKLYDKSMKTDD